MGNAHLSRPCRFRPRTMIFDFSMLMLVVLLITCTVVCPSSPSHTFIHHLFILRALPLRTTLLPSYSRNIHHTHSQAHPAAFSSSRHSFQFCLVLAPVFVIAFCSLFCSHPYSCPNPRSRCTYSSRQVFIGSIIYLHTILLPGDELTLVDHVFLGPPAAGAVGCIGKNSKSSIVV